MAEQTVLTGEQLRAAMCKTHNKYGVRTDKDGVAERTVNGIKFASKREAERYQALVLREQQGHIRELKLQPSFPLVVNGVKVCTYRADFSYVEVESGETVIEDVKGMRTPVYRLKKKLFEAVTGLRIHEVR